MHIRHLAPLALAALLAMALPAFSACSSSSASQEKASAQINREYMSSVNSIAAEAADALADFGDAASENDVAGMRLAADAAEKALGKIGELSVPDALEEVHDEYEAGAADVSEALDGYIEIYAAMKAAGDDSDAVAEAAEGISEVQELYESGIEHLSAADAKVAELAGDGASSTETASSSGSDS